MTKQITNLIGVAVLLASASAFAQSANTTRINVPFPFVTAGKTWPAGEYMVQTNPQTGMLTVSAPGITAANQLTITDARTGESRSFLRFQRYGDVYVLEGVAQDGTLRIPSSSGSEIERAKLKLSCQEASGDGCSNNR
jgi:hypothetical protein